jgi:hypothetical protein
MHETPERERGDGRAAGQPQGLGAKAYFSSTSQGARPEDARLPARRGSSSERRTAKSAVAAGRSCIMRARALSQEWSVKTVTMVLTLCVLWGLTEAGSADDKPLISEVRVMCLNSGIPILSHNRK